jgi:hypothetical protein
MKVIAYWRADDIVRVVLRLKRHGSTLVASAGEEGMRMNRELVWGASPNRRRCIVNGRASP